MSERPTQLTVLERAAQGVLGAPLDRTDGPPKVTGGATYSYEFDRPDALYGHVIAAQIGRATIDAIDCAAAATMPGVVRIITDHPRLPAEGLAAGVPGIVAAREIFYFGQPIGIVVAETAEAARAAADAVSVRYTPLGGRFEADLTEPEEAEPATAFLRNMRAGDIDAAIEGAAHRYDAVFTTPAHFPAAMEPHATLAEWDGDRLTLHSSLQGMAGTQRMFAIALDMPVEQIRVVAPYVGGGFGGKTGIGAEAILAAIAAREVDRPVKVVLTRRQTAQMVHHRSATRQRVRIATDADHRIVALGHDSVVAQRPTRAFVEPVPFGTIHTYAGAARSFTTGLSRADLPVSGAVRSPGEAIGMLALEVAMDEMAEQLGLDPIEFRILNEPEVSPMTGKLFSTRHMVECYREGARRFGWDARPDRPGQRREGEWLIGMGMAAAVRGNFTVEARARLTLEPDGSAVVETDMTDIGTGTYTVLTQMAAETLGIDPARITVRLGDSDLPPTSGSGGSFGASSASSAVALAAAEIAAQIAAKMGTAPDRLTLKDGTAIADNRQVALPELLEGEAISAEGHAKPHDKTHDYAQSSWGAHFAEVAVNAVTGEVRVRRMLGVFDVGRVLNRKTARSQLLGGMIWGIGSVLTEDAVVDTRTGQFVNPDFGEYHLAVHADAPPCEVHFIEEIDTIANQAGAKAVGELGNSGAGAAVANAIYNACGARVRDFPITLDKLLPLLPAL